MNRDNRVEAVGVLYAADAVGELRLYPGLSSRAMKLATAVWEHRAELDAELGAVAAGWRVARMPAVDRAVLRLALYELRHTTTPPAVVISEAVELVKEYSTARSGAFVNGVLASLLSEGTPE